jgi:hypothetical protein
VGISSITGTSIGTKFQWTAGNSLTGSNYNQTVNSGAISKSMAFGTAAGNTEANGGDEVFSFQQTITAGSSVTIDLDAMTNLLQQAAVSIARIKGVQIRLLNLTDDATITAPGATAVLVTNIGPTLPAALGFQGGGTGLTLALTTSAGAITGVAIGAAGSGYVKSSTFLVSPQQASGAGGLVAVTTNSSGVPTTVALIAAAAGTGYSNATVPTVGVGNFTILAGGAYCYFDPLPAGFCLVSSVGKNIRIHNLDGTNVATVEIDVFGATT